MLSQMTTLLQGRIGGGAPDMMMRGGHGFFLLGGLGNLLWTVLIVLVVLWIVNNWSKITGWFSHKASALKSSAPVTTAKTPLEVVQMRYAKGEISREEYETLRRDLGGESQSIPVTEEPAQS